MPRVARIKNNESVVYIIVRGISDVHLFRDDEDKNSYLELIGRYKNLYGFKLYAYCIMDDFAHFIVDLCGADISTIMSSINVGYSGKYNRKYNRHGHVFNDRFRSKIVKDELELKALTLYIHNSPVTIKDYEKHPEKYRYSSLGAYIGDEDPFKITDEAFISDFIGSGSEERKKYFELVPLYDSEKLINEIEFYSKISNSRYYSKSPIPKINPEDILDFVSSNTGISRIRLDSKYVKDARNARALAVFIMKNYCHYKTSEICKFMGETCLGNISDLFNYGLDLIEKNEEYNLLADKFKREYAE